MNNGEWLCVNYVFVCLADFQGSGLIADGQMTVTTVFSSLELETRLKTLLMQPRRLTIHLNSRCLKDLVTFHTQKKSVNDQGKPLVHQ